VAQAAHVVVSTVPEGESGSSGGEALDRESDVTAQRKLERRQRKRQGRAGVSGGLPSRVTEIELREFDANLDRLRQLLQRVDRQELEPEDWAVLSAVLREAM
jgi:hypothetical protein